jgi:30S ribosomal protein S31
MGMVSLGNKTDGMGKGDKKSKRGKIANKSYGARRPRKIKKKPTVEERISIKNKS